MKILNGGDEHEGKGDEADDDDEDGDGIRAELLPKPLILGQAAVGLVVEHDDW